MKEGEPGFTPEDDISPQEIREHLNNPNYLPSHDDVVRAFGNKWSEDWHFYFFNKETPRFELLNQEFIESLSSYLNTRVEELGATQEKPVTILDVGAGDGRLTHFISKSLQTKSLGKFQMIAVDDGERGIKPNFPVEQVSSVEDALRKHQPDIVICSWMEDGKDWTVFFRNTQSVKEYILIGEPEICGTESSWSEHKGFSKRELEEVTRQQMCRTDESPVDCFKSKTISYRRES
ncbi:hypothetical protein ES702_06675 [subsurface metagenome]